MWGFQFLFQSVQTIFESAEFCLFGTQLFLGFRFGCLPLLFFRCQAFKLCHIPGDFVLDLFPVRCRQLRVVYGFFETLQSRGHFLPAPLCSSEPCTRIIEVFRSARNGRFLSLQPVKENLDP